MKKYMILIVTTILVLLLIAIAYYKKNVPELDPHNKVKLDTNLNFDYKMIKLANSHANKSNYMISPLSIAYALSILEEGATNNTKDEIDKVLNNYSLPKIINIKNRISLANALFIKNDYPVKDKFIEDVRNKYNSEVLYDEFQTPKVINDWVNEKTYKMIPNVLDSIDPLFKVGIANALAIDVEWQNKFECTSTKKDVFTLSNNTTMDTAMMHSKNDISYFEIKGAKGIVKDYAKYNPNTGNIDYENGTQLEFIAIMPDDIDIFIDNMDSKVLEEINKNLRKPGEKLEINLSLPKFTYDYNYEAFKGDLIELGIKDAFNSINASFKNIADKELYVSDAIHKSHIELSENGTKAAAVTIFMMRDSAMIREDEKEIINIKFDKPFIYIIKDKESNNIWFFGTVYEPMKFENNSKCEIK